MSNNKKTIKKTQIESSAAQTKRSGKWTEEEDFLLQQIVPIYNERHWRKISLHMKGRSAIQCLHRWTKILKPGLVKGPWSIEEDEKLKTWIQEKGPIKWAQCAKGIPGRSGKQCRERWFNNLNPNVKKGDWTPEEDDLIFKLYVNYGSSWSKIAMHFNDRTENSIKNRFYSTIRKLYSDKKKIEKGKTIKRQVKKQISTLEEKSNQEVATIEKEPENKTEESKVDSSKDDNKDLINTLYQLLKASDIQHPPHINKIYSSGIYKKSRKYKRKMKGEKLTEESLQSLQTRESSVQMKEEAYCSDNESDSNFENFLNSIEKTINKELILRDINSFKDMSLEELQNKVFDFCNDNPLSFEPEEGMHAVQLEKILNQQIEKEIFEGDHKNPEKILEKAIGNEILSKFNDDSQESNQKMNILVQQLQTLENMLTKTRQELMSLENSLQRPENLERMAVLHKEEDSFLKHFEQIAEIPEWNSLKRKASLSLEEMFDFHCDNKKAKKMTFLEEEFPLFNFKEEN